LDNLTVPGLRISDGEPLLANDQRSLAQMAIARIQTWAFLRPNIT
jgi:hypothetical protein